MVTDGNPNHTWDSTPALVKFLPFYLQHPYPEFNQNKTQGYQTSSWHLPTFLNPEWSHVTTHGTQFWWVIITNRYGIQVGGETYYHHRWYCRVYISWYSVPIAFTFPKPYLRLQEIITNIDDALPKPYEWTHDCIKDPKSTLAYIITHYNIEKVSKSIWAFPPLNFDQICYLTYINTSRYSSLQHLIEVSGRNLRVHNALVQKQLGIQIRYARYQVSDDLNPYLLQCIL